MIELKPCPFCGGTAKIRHDYDGNGYSYVECEKCHMKSTRFMRLFERSAEGLSRATLCRADRPAKAMNR